MVNPGAFHGSRKEFLIGEKDAYRTGIQGGYTADILADIQRRYFKRYPINLPHHEEPSAEQLESINDDAPDDEPEYPSEEGLSPEEYAEALKAVEECRTLIKQRKAVSRLSLVWFPFQTQHDKTANQTLDGVPTHEGQRPQSKRLGRSEPVPYPLASADWYPPSASKTQDRC